jgi:hypothetical protein
VPAGHYGLAHPETMTDETIGMVAPPGTFFDFAVVHIVTTASPAQV